MEYKENVEIDNLEPFLHTLLSKTQQKKIKWYKDGLFIRYRTPDGLVSIIKLEKEKFKDGIFSQKRKKEEWYRIDFNGKEQTVSSPEYKSDNDIKREVGVGDLLNLIFTEALEQVFVTAEHPFLGKIFKNIESL